MAKRILVGILWLVLVAGLTHWLVWFDVFGWMPRPFEWCSGLLTHRGWLCGDVGVDLMLAWFKHAAVALCASAVLCLALHDYRLRYLRRIVLAIGALLLAAALASQSVHDLLLTRL